MIATQELIEKALQLSRADACIVIADETNCLNIRWANNELTSNGFSRSRQLTIISILNSAGGTSTGVVLASGVTCESLETLVRKAEGIARATVPAKDAQPLLTGRISPNWDEPSPETSVEVLSRFVPAMGGALSRARCEGRLLFGYAEHASRSTYLASSTGLRLRHDQPAGRVEMNAKSCDHYASVWGGTVGTTVADIDVEELELYLTRRLGWARRRLKLPAGRYETLLLPSPVADLMLWLYSSAGARNAHDGGTVFSKYGDGTRIGERISPVSMSLRSDPATPGLQCNPFVVAYASGDTSSIFDNGLPLLSTNWISDGTLSALVQTRLSASLAGLPVTPRIDNLILEGPLGMGHALDEMIANTARGLLVSSLWYIREADPRTLLLTGLTRDGVFLIERGEIVGAVNNFRFNESPVDLLGRIGEVGITERTLPREEVKFMGTAMPPLRISDFNMSSVSEAL
jgi:predicted Zn-dependent protease